MTIYQFIAIVIAVAVALSAVMTGAWLIWRGTRNSGWVDCTWTFGLGAIGTLGALFTFLPSGEAMARRIWVAALIAGWALRLGLHIAQRSGRRSDDPRYANLIRGWGAHAPWRMFFLLQEQALVSVPLALAMVLAALNPAPGLRAQDVAAVALLLIGIAGEALADAQLRRFRANQAGANEGRANPGRANKIHGLCDVGLWRWSRHPNYFFEWFGWLAYPLFAIDVGGAYPWGYAALAGPLCMYWLLVHVSGIPPLEAHMLDRNPERFRAYQARTNAFFPAPPRLSAQVQR
jgi:steroid 5-alpha reductase family enzyme